MVKARKYVAIKRFGDVPNREDFEIVEYELPPLQNGEILVKTEWISVDPYQQFFNALLPIPHDQLAYQVGLVEDSKDPKYPVGTRVVSHKGWCDYSVINTTDPPKFFLDMVYKLPDLQGLSNSLGVGTVGMTGATAYFGLLELCKPKPGETVVVTTAAGAVGSVAGQIAKIKGCRVIGFAGSDKKVKWLEQELGFDKAFNYKTVDVRQVLEMAAPDGVDCYFDNVGGEVSSIIISQMNDFGRVAVCGSISVYNEVDRKVTRAPVIQLDLAKRQLKMEGFIVTRWKERWSEAFADIAGWIKSGKLIARDHVTEGFENILDALVGMMNGENMGKAVVKI